MKNCIIITKDLMFGSQMHAGAAAAGWESMTRLDPDALTPSEDYVLLVDLNFPGLDLSRSVPAWRQLDPPPRAVIAVGSHVHVQKLDAAAAAGCEHVLSKGQAATQLSAVLDSI